jgi:hypothetical protein
MHGGVLGSAKRGMKGRGEQKVVEVDSLVDPLSCCSDVSAVEWITAY